MTQAEWTVPPPICRPCGRRQHWPDVVCSPDLCPGWRDPDPRFPIALAYVPIAAERSAIVP
jgi:hypothetical protein